MEGDTKAKGVVIAEACLDLVIHVGDCQHKIIRAPRSCTVPVTYPAPQLRDKRDLEGGPAAEYILGGSRDRGAPGLRPPLHKEARHRMKGWYNYAADRALPPARVSLERITAEHDALYHQVPPPEDNISIYVYTLQVE